MHQQVEQLVQQVLAFLEVPIDILRKVRIQANMINEPQFI